MSVITVSRQFGAGGMTLGKMIADELGYIFADSDIIQGIAEAAHVSPSFVQTVEMEAGTPISKVIKRMVPLTMVDRILKSEQGYMDEKLYLDYLVVIIAQIAEEGNAVILGRGSQYILHDHPDAFHILLIDQFENRVKFLQEHYNLSEKRATHLAHSEEKRRANFFHMLGKTDYENAALYHLVLNMSRIDLPKALKLVLELVHT